MTSFSPWKGVNVAQSISAASDFQTTWHTVWSDPRIRDVFIFNSYQMYPTSVLCHCLKTQADEMVK